MTFANRQSVCGMSIVKDYYKLQKFNVMEIAKSNEPGFQESGALGRVQEKPAGKEQNVSEAE